MASAAWNDELAGQFTGVRSTWAYGEKKDPDIKPLVHTTAATTDSSNNVDVMCWKAIAPFLKRANALLKKAEAGGQ